MTLDLLVDEFVGALFRHGIIVDRQAVEQEMRERIADIARHLGVDAETVLREHARPGWGREMSVDVIDQLQARPLQTPAAG